MYIYQKLTYKLSNISKSLIPSNTETEITDLPAVIFQSMKEILLRLIKNNFHKIKPTDPLNYAIRLVIQNPDTIIAIYDEKENFYGIINNKNLTAYLYSEITNTTPLALKKPIAILFKTKDFIITPPVLSAEELSAQQIAMLMEKHEYIAVKHTNTNNKPSNQNDKPSNQQEEIIGFITPLEIARNLQYFTHLSLYDPLTNLYNRNYLEIVKRKVEENKISVIFIDLDNFKTINDTYGHHEGDKILQEFSQFLKNFFRQSDIIIRYGGDEFLIILTGTSPQNIENMINRIETAFFQNSHFNKLYKKHKFHFSYGYSSIPPCNSIKEAILEADKKMYEIKKQKNSLTTQQTIKTKIQN